MERKRGSESSILYVPQERGCRTHNQAKPQGLCPCKHQKQAQTFTRKHRLTCNLCPYRSFPGFPATESGEDAGTNLALAPFLAFDWSLLPLMYP